MWGNVNQILISPHFVLKISQNVKRIMLVGLLWISIKIKYILLFRLIEWESRFYFLENFAYSRLLF